MVYSDEEVVRKLREVLTDAELLYVVSVFETDLFGNESVSQQHAYITLADVHSLLLDLLEDISVSFTVSKNCTEVSLGVLNKNTKIVIMSVEDLKQGKKW